MKLALRTLLVATLFGTFVSLGGCGACNPCGKMDSGCKM